MAILREQGVNSHLEMAYSMDRAGFDTHDVHMSDLIAGRGRAWPTSRASVACGGFRYGDVLGAGEGWAEDHPVQCADGRASSRASSTARTPSALGVCNGCQMLSNLAPIIPGANAWPKFTRN